MLPGGHLARGNLLGRCSCISVKPGNYAKDKEKLQAGIQRKTGLTLHLHILKVRPEKAKELLRDTDHPVKSIAVATGFKRASHFIDIFKKFHSLTPNQYRLQLAV